MRRLGSILLPLIFVVAAILLPLVAGPYPLALFKTVFVYMALALAWDILLRSGQISFGIAGMFGLGSYLSAIAVLRFNLPAGLSILVAALLAALVAFILGFVILRLRHTYFSITTLALGEIFRVIFHNGGEATGGAEGVVLKAPILGGDPKSLYWMALGIVLVCVIVSVVFQKTRLRLGLAAIRNNEVSAKSSGINIFKYMMIAFVVSTCLMAMVGAFSVQSLGFVTPESAFDGYYTLLPLAMALLGGTYSTPGPIIGSLLLGLVAELLKLKIPYGHLVVYGIIIIVVILFMPQGLWGLFKGKKKAKAAPPAASAQVKEAGNA